MSDLQPIPVLARSTPGQQFGTLAAVGPGTVAASVAPASSATAVPDTTSSAWGQNIAYLFAQCQVLGLPLWTSSTVEYAAQADGGAGYKTDFAVIFGRNGTDGAQCFIKKIIFDGVELITGDGAGGSSASGDFTYVFYDGTQTTHDPTIHAQEHPYAPAFMGMVYLVVKGYTVLGDNAYPQVIGQFVHSFVGVVEGGSVGAAGTPGAGGNTYPMLIGNALTPGTNTTHCVWEWTNNLFYSHRQWANFYGDKQTYFDIYDAGPKTYTRSIQAGMLTLANFDFDVSPIDQMIYALADHSYNLINPDNGSLILNRTITPYNNTANVHVCRHLVAGFYELFYVSLNSGFFTVNKRNSDNTVKLLYGFQVTVTSGSTAPIGPWADVLDYTTLPSVDQFEITYFCCDGGIGRSIFPTGTDGTVPTTPATTVGIAFAHESDGSRHNVTITKSAEFKVLYYYPDLSYPQQIYVSDDGRQVYVIVYLISASEWRIERYDTFYELYNSSKPLSSGTRTEDQILGVDGGFDMFTLVYSVALPVAIGITLNYATNTRPLGQNKVAVCDGSGEALLIVDLTDGSAITIGAGNWKEVPALGTTDYGFNLFPMSVLYDQSRGTRGALFYYAMSGGHTDFAGLLFPGAGGALAYTLGDAFHDLSVLAGISSDLIALSGLEDTITGMALNQGVNYTDLISQMASTFRVDVIETPDLGIKFVRRSSDEIDFVVTPDIMVVTADDGHMVDFNYLGSNELPNILQLSYVDPDQAFQVGIQSARRVVYPQVTVLGKTQVQVSVPIVMTADRAQYFVGYALFDMWAGAITFVLTVPPQLAKVEVGDVAIVTIQTGRQIQAKVTSLQINADKSVTLNFSASTINHFVPKKQILPDTTGGGGL